MPLSSSAIRCSLHFKREDEKIAYSRHIRVSTQFLLSVVSVLVVESFRFEDENEDQGQLLLTVRMLKSVTVMA